MPARRMAPRREKWQKNWDNWEASLLIGTTARERKNSEQMKAIKAP
jgi:hypothetical protein